MNSLGAAYRCDIACQRADAKKNGIGFQIAFPGRRAQANTLTQAMNSPVRPGWHAAHNGNRHPNLLRIEGLQRVLYDHTGNRPIAQRISYRFTRAQNFMNELRVNTFCWNSGLKNRSDL